MTSGAQVGRRVYLLPSAASAALEGALASQCAAGATGNRPLCISVGNFGQLSR